MFRVARRRILLIVIILFASSGLAGWAYLRSRDHLSYRTVAVERGDIEATVSATGTLNAVVTVDVGSQVSGNIKQIFVDFNSKVRKGQLIAQIDPQIFEARVKQAEDVLNASRAAVLNMRASLDKANAGVASAEAAIDNAKSTVGESKLTVADDKAKLERAQELFRDGLLATQDRDSAQITYDSSLEALKAARTQVVSAQDSLRAAQASRAAAQTQLDQAIAQEKQNEAALKQAEIDLENTNIYAPVDGTVISRNVNVGQTVAASLEAPTLFVIAQDLSKMQVDTNVDEADIGKVRVGQSATFTVDAYPGRTLQGVVSQIRKAPLDVQNVVTYDVVIFVPNSDLKLLPGMTANVQILLESHDHVLRIPNSALLFSPPEAAKAMQAESQPSAKPGAGFVNRQTVWVLGPDGKPRSVEVALGITDGNYTEITGGRIEQGQQVIVGLAPGSGNTGTRALGRL